MSDEYLARIADALEGMLAISDMTLDLMKDAEADRKLLVAKAEAQEEFVARALSGQMELDS